MKKFLLALFPSLLILIISCSDNSGSSTDPFGGGSGGTGGVTWQIGNRQGQQGIIFTAQPSTAVTVTQVTVSLPAQNFNDVVQGDGTTVFQPGQFYDISEYTGVASGQQWTFKFEGKLGNAQGQAYNVTSNYTFP
jgi:hypothetical protein